jgi:hypothetical protein
MSTVQRFEVSVRRLLVTANVVPSSPILVTSMMEALSSSETAVLTTATRRNMPEGDILLSAEVWYGEALCFKEFRSVLNCASIYA